MVDEPMAILAAMKWLGQKPEFSMFTFLHQDIGKHTPRRNGFEAYLVFHVVGLRRLPGVLCHLLYRAPIGR